MDQKTLEKELLEKRAAWLREFPFNGHPKRSLEALIRKKPATTIANELGVSAEALR